MEDVVKDDGGCEAVIDNHRYCLPHCLQYSYDMVLPSLLGDQYPRLPCNLLCQPPLL